MSTIYVLSEGEDGPCKIGISTNPMKRINGLQTACWKQLEVKFCGFVATTNVARELEKK